MVLGPPFLSNGVNFICYDSKLQSRVSYWWMQQVNRNKMYKESLITVTLNYLIVSVALTNNYWNFYQLSFLENTLNVIYNSGRLQENFSQPISIFRLDNAGHDQNVHCKLYPVKTVIDKNVFPLREILGLTLEHFQKDWYSFYLLLLSGEICDINSVK